ncbi:MAG TPA: rhomboid family intramembrane serine protease [Polyangia bacterium]|jgi:membrane associated rhomboid family serine protease|nr:rhomboid family intramembrane serine protease [Polyangia bacterium]
MPDLPHGRRPSQAWGSPSWTRPIRERLTPAIKALVIAETLVFAFYRLVPQSHAFLAEHVALGPGLFQGQVWQLGTALFIHTDGLSLILNLIGLWFVGAFTERTAGTRRFLLLFFGAGALSNLAIAGVARLGSMQTAELFFGASYAILALFVAYGRTYAGAQTQILGGLYMQAQNLALLLVGWSLVASLFQRDWAGVAGTLTASAVGYFMAGGNLGELARVLRRLWPRRARRRYQVLEGGQSRGTGKRQKFWN